MGLKYLYKNILPIINERSKPQPQQNKNAYLNKFDNNMHLKNEYKNISPINYNNAQNRPESQQVNNN